MENAAPKIKHLTGRMNNGNDELKNVNIFFKIISRQCSQLRRHIDDSFDQWKVIPLFFLYKTFSENNITGYI